MYRLGDVVLEEEVIARIPEIAIYRYYLESGDIEVGRAFCSPFREDNNPSCSLYYNDEGRLMMIDHGGYFFGSWVDVVSKVRNVPAAQVPALVMRELSDRDFGNLLSREARQRRSRRKSVIDAEIKPYDMASLKYWLDYGIDLSILRQFRVYPLEKVSVDYRPMYQWRNDTNPVYGYYFGRGRWKIYAPLFLDRKRRFRSNTSVYQGLEQLPDRGELLVITSSLKDVMVLSKYGIPAIAPNGESARLNAAGSPIPDLQRRFRRIVVFYDNDEAGIRMAIRANADLGFPYVYLSGEQKDISDYIKHYGYERTKHALQHLNLLSMDIDFSSAQRVKLNARELRTDNASSQVRVDQHHIKYNNGSRGHSFVFTKYAREKFQLEANSLSSLIVPNTPRVFLVRMPGRDGDIYKGAPNSSSKSLTLTNTPLAQLLAQSNRLSKKLELRERGLYPADGPEEQFRGKMILEVIPVDTVIDIDGNDTNHPYETFNDGEDPQHTSTEGETTTPDQPREEEVEERPQPAADNDPQSSSDDQPSQEEQQDPEPQVDVDSNRNHNAGSMDLPDQF